MTVDMLRVGRRRGGRARRTAASRDVWRVAPGALLGRDLTVEPDLSNAAPFLAAALVTGGRVTVPRLAASAPPSPATRCARSSPGWAARCELDRARA